MMDGAWAARYAYLAFAAGWTVAVIVLARLLLSTAQFHLTVLSGLLAVPAFIYGYFLEGNYWHPPRIGGLSVGVEDALISFAMSAIAWLVVALVFGRRLQFHFDRWVSLRRYLVATVGPGLAFLWGVWLGLDGMSALLLAYGVTGPFFAWTQSANWPLAAAGIPLFALAWFLVLAIGMHVYPPGLYFWNLEGPWGGVVGGVPKGEIVWAICYGAFWPLFTAHVYELKLKQNRQI